MPRAYVAWIVTIVFADQSKTYHGPFLREEDAKDYAGSSDEIVDYKIEPLIVPHRVLLSIDMR